MNALTFDQQSALMLRARREFFEEQDGVFEDMLQQQRARSCAANPEPASRATPTRPMALTDHAAAPRTTVAASGLVRRLPPVPTPQADIVAQEQRTARRKRRQCRSRDEAVAEVGL
eukprot:COSAG01_NODE_4539_length_4936_cov_3.074013_6_plen_116_part_00